MIEITGSAVINGKKYSASYATNDSGEGLFYWSLSDCNWHQIMGNCQFYAGRQNQYLKKFIREKLIETAINESHSGHFSCNRFKVTYK